MILKRKAMLTNEIKKHIKNKTHGEEQAKAAAEHVVCFQVVWCA